MRSPKGLAKIRNLKVVCCDSLQPGGERSSMCALLGTRQCTLRLVSPSQSTQVVELILCGIQLGTAGRGTRGQRT